MCGRPLACKVGADFFGHAFACVPVSGLLAQRRLLAKMVCAGGRSNQSGDLDGHWFVRFISRYGSNDPVHLSFSCKFGKGALAW